MRSFPSCPGFEVDPSRSEKLADFSSCFTRVPVHPGPGEKLVCPSIVMETSGCLKASRVVTGSEQGGHLLK